MSCPRTFTHAISSKQRVRNSYRKEELRERIGFLVNVARAQKRLCNRCVMESGSRMGGRGVVLGEEWGKGDGKWEEVGSRSML